MVKEEGALHRYDRYFTGETIRVGDIVETYGSDGVRLRGRIVKHFLPKNNNPEARDWNMEGGGIMIEFKGHGLIGYGPADDELFLFREGHNNALVVIWEGRGLSPANSSGLQWRAN